MYMKKTVLMEFEFYLYLKVHIYVLHLQLNQWLLIPLKSSPFLDLYDAPYIELNTMNSIEKGTNHSENNYFFLVTFSLFYYIFEIQYSIHTNNYIFLSVIAPSTRMKFCLFIYFYVLLYSLFLLFHIHKWKICEGHQLREKSADIKCNALSLSSNGEITHNPL